MADDELEQPAHGASRGWLTPGVVGIGGASFLSDLGHEVPTALLPGLLTSTLGASAAALGVIEGISDALAGAAKVAGGPPADDPGRRRTIAVGGYVATAASHRWWVPRPRRLRSPCFERAMDNLGAVFGPLLALLLLSVQRSCWQAWGSASLRPPNTRLSPPSPRQIFVGRGSDSPTIAFSYLAAVMVVSLLLISRADRSP